MYVPAACCAQCLFTFLLLRPGILPFSPFITSTSRRQAVSSAKEKKIIRAVSGLSNISSNTHQSFTMAQRSLTDLPVEILQQIAGLVRDASRPSFYAFCAINKPCRLACTRLFFRKLHVSVNGCRALQTDVDFLLKSLLSTVCGGDATQHVRHLCLKDSLSLMRSEVTRMHSDTDDPDLVYPYYLVSMSGQLGRNTPPTDLEIAAEYEQKLQQYRSEGLDELLGEKEPTFANHYLGERDPFVTPEQDAAWTPVVNLIKSLPYLTKLVYNCRSQFPPSLLNVLHSHHPQCRLYHHTFRLRSLRSKFDHLDPHELAVATSPCLHSIRLRCSDFNEDAEPDQNLPAILQLVAGHAPNLKEVFVLHVNLIKRHYPRSDPPWHGLPGIFTGSLTLLSITGQVAPGAWSPSIQTWANHTDFSLLRHLSLGVPRAHDLERGILFNPEGLGLTTEALESLARTCSFPRLESLHIRLLRRRETRIIDSQADAKYINAATAFFGSIRPLRKLSVKGSILPEILDTILSRHGRTVVDLKLYPFENKVEEPEYSAYVPMTFTKAQILQIKAHCPVLESLSIHIKRTMSDRSEVELYTSLARIEPLQFLHLTLDCSNWRVIRVPDSENEVWFDEDDKVEFDSSRMASRWLPGVKRGHVRQNLINCAVDESLARSIWDVIAKHKDGKRLLSLKLHTFGAGNFGGDISTLPPGLSELARHLSRSWLIERSIRDDEQDAIRVRELGLQGRRADDEKLQDDWRLRPEELRPVVQIFRRIWPEKEFGRPWLDDWTSYPLQI